MESNIDLSRNIWSSSGMAELSLVNIEVERIVEFIDMLALI